MSEMKRALLLLPKLTGPLRSYYNLFFGEKEIKYLHQYLKQYNKNYDFIDVGANYGIYSFLFGYKSKLTFIIEPVKECIEYIKGGYMNDNVKFFEKVASNSDNKKILNIPFENKKLIFGKSSLENIHKDQEQIRVESFKLDSLYCDLTPKDSNLVFIKIDVEGHEEKVIDGCKKILSSKKTLLLIEIEQRHNKNYLNTFNKLLNSGFKAYHVEKNYLRELKNADEFKDAMKYNINFLFKNY
tara:strand:+ start:863 stop:1585 length:723 start_codon:yes stop_codon:yes gene_type:complete